VINIVPDYLCVHYFRENKNFTQCIMFLVTLIVILLVIVRFWHKIKYQRRYELLSKIPAPKKYPIIHNSIEYLKIDPKHTFYWFIDMDKKYGPVYHMTTHPFDEGFCFISDAKVVEDLLTNQQEISKTTDYDMLKEWLGTGLLISSGKKWHQRRKILTSGFHFQILEKFAQIMNEQAKVFMKKLESADTTNVDFLPIVKLFALDTVCGKI
jgi:cytochrome P450 family 4